MSRYMLRISNFPATNCSIKTSSSGFDNNVVGLSHCFCLPDASKLRPCIREHIADSKLHYAATMWKQSSVSPAKNFEGTRFLSS